MSPRYKISRLRTPAGVALADWREVATDVRGRTLQCVTSFRKT
ncbi:MAG TPA: hypothetical protein VN664_08690 [Burkholderiales bacterium]|nr:hypothetical protein [Burkholderiales bacterium]